MRESVKRIRKQTAVLQTALADNVNTLARLLFDVPFEIISTNPHYAEIFSKMRQTKIMLEETDPQSHTTKPRIQKEGTRLVKCGCSGCGYNFRVTRMWIEIGIPKCPNRDCERFGKEMEPDLARDTYAEFTDSKKNAGKRYDKEMETMLDPFADLPGAGDWPEYLKEKS